MLVEQQGWGGHLSNDREYLAGLPCVTRGQQLEGRGLAAWMAGGEGLMVGLGRTYKRGCGVSMPGHFLEGSWDRMHQAVEANGWGSQAG